MAYAARTSHDDLIRSLTEAPHRYGFYQALRLLEATHADAPGFARSQRARQDPVRLGQAAHLDFASATLRRVEPATDERPERLLQNFHGLFGPNGPLPVHLTEYAMERSLSWHDPTLERFCDVFHHRMLSLFYRLWANAEPAVCEDRPEHNRFRTYIGALAGLGLPSLREQDALPDQAKLFHAGLLANQKRSPEGLLCIISQQFGMPVRLHEYQPEWLPLPHDARLHLGDARSTGSLGVNTVLGARTFERQFRFSIVFGPLGLADFESLLPDQPVPRKLSALVRNYVGLEFSWDYAVLVHEDDMPAARPGEYGQLGWSTWLSGRAREPDKPDFIHSPDSGLSQAEAMHG